MVLGFRHGVILQLHCNVDAQGCRVKDPTSVSQDSVSQDFGSEDDYWRALGRRVQDLIDAVDMKKGELSATLAFSSNSNITGIVRGTQRLSAYQLYLIACATNASHSWLVADVGEMFSDPDAAEVTLGEIRRLLDRHRDAVARELLDVDPENGDGPDAP